MKMNSDIHSINLLHFFFFYLLVQYTLHAGYVICLLPDSNVNDSADTLNLENWKCGIPSGPDISVQVFCSLKDPSYIPQFSLFQKEKNTKTKQYYLTLDNPDMY